MSFQGKQAPRKAYAKRARGSVEAAILAHAHRILNPPLVASARGHLAGADALAGERAPARFSRRGFATAQGKQVETEVQVLLQAEQVTQVVPTAVQ